MNSISPPRLARLFISLVVPASEREFFLGDLDEDFQQRVQFAGRRHARGWYWREALRAPGWWHRSSPDFVPVHAERAKGELMLSVVQDIRYAFRSLIKSSSLLFFALASLALGIGANTAVFSVVNGILLKPLPYGDPDRLVRLWDSNPPANLPFFSVAYGNFLEWEKQTKLFAGLGAYREDGFSEEIIRDGLRLILPGVAAGTLGALAATRLLSKSLFGVTAADPLTFAVIAAFLTLIGVLACFIPARKAASVDPLVALRNE